MAAEDNLPAKKDAAGQMDLALAREFIDVQRKEMELRATELALRKEAQTQGHEYALSSLSAQGTDRNAERVHQRVSARQYLIFAGCIFLVLIVFAALALHWGREAVVMEAVKALSIFVGGLGAGAVLGYRKAQKDTLRLADEVSDSDG